MHYYFRAFDSDGNIYVTKLYDHKWYDQQYSQVGKLLAEGRTTVSMIYSQLYPRRTTNTNKVVKPMHVLAVERDFNYDEVLCIFNSLPPHLDLRTVNSNTYPELFI